MTNDVIFTGALDGRFSAHSSKDGIKLWEFDTLRSFNTVNAVPAVGGSIDSDLGDSRLIGFCYQYYGQHGQKVNVILAFSLN